MIPKMQIETFFWLNLYWYVFVLNHQPMGIHFKPIELSLKKNNMNCFFLLKNKGQKALQYPKNDGCDSGYELTIGIDGGGCG